MRAIGACALLTPDPHALLFAESLELYQLRLLAKWRHKPQRLSVPVLNCLAVLLSVLPGLPAAMHLNCCLMPLASAAGLYNDRPGSSGP